MKTSSVSAIMFISTWKQCGGRKTVVGTADNGFVWINSIARDVLRSDRCGKKSGVVNLLTGTERRINEMSEVQMDIAKAVQLCARLANEIRELKEHTGRKLREERDRAMLAWEHFAKQRSEIHQLKQQVRILQKLLDEAVGGDDE